MRLSYLNQPWDGAGERIGDHLNGLLRQDHPRFDILRIAVAFAKSTGVLRLADGLRLFHDNGGSIEVVVGIERKGTSQQALRLLMELCHRVIVFHNEGAPTFHPKLYLFGTDQHAIAFIGSSNLTVGGLYINYEHNLRLDLDLTREEDLLLYQRLNEAYLSLAEARGGIARELDGVLLQQLIERGMLLDEDAAPAAAGEAEEGTEEEEQGRPLFGTVPIPPPPPAPRARRAPPPRTPARPGPALAGREYFVISVLEGDLPQPGSSNEIRITKGIRNANPAFWGWPDLFEGPHPDTGQYHRDITIRFDHQILNAYLKDFPGRKPDGTKASADFRIGSIAPIVQNLREEDDLLILTRTGAARIDFEARIVHKRNRRGYENVAEGMIQHTRARSTATGTYKKYKYGQIE